TTDSFVVDPIFFNGGNIGKLSICGTVNDLSVVGAIPLYLSLSLIIEEGLAINELEEIIKTISHEAMKANIKIVCGDTKVVENGNGDKLFINTTGIGVISRNRPLGMRSIKVGDKIIISGTIGEHGAAIMNERNNLCESSLLKSDCQSLNGIIESILNSSSEIKVMRDPTRGGVITTLLEIIDASNKEMLIYEDKLPISSEVSEFSDLLGLNPLYMANEGKVIIIVSNQHAIDVLNLLRNSQEGQEATIIGEVIADGKKNLYLETIIGAKIKCFPMKGEQLPRIC
ncbi:hydrogenase expression/formation protein HypE, partial [Clostridium sp.]